MKNKKNSSLLESFVSAFSGLFFVLKRERNFKIHLSISFFVIIFSLFFHIPFTEVLIIMIFISMVIVSEITNTAFEILSENIDKEEIVKTIKDIGAASVLISSIFAFICGYLIFIKYFPSEFRNIFVNIASSSWYFTFFVLIIVSFLTLILKFISEKKFTLTGGMPSIHSGISFSIWTAISILTFKDYPVISPLVLLLSIWVAQSRITKKIHSVEEVIIGGIIGIIITVLLFQILWRD
ncbi:MAG: diacylglycerol kinase [Candidatus Omnitrophica bacterium]|nr:diacylglycerol kinase [Candidatus Omnitrophota bacterium]